MRPFRLLALCVATGFACLPGQQLFDSVPGRSLRFHTSDIAVLGADGSRDDIECEVEPLRPRLNFDLKYTAGYAVKLPASAVAQSGEHLRVLFRVQPLGDDGLEPVYFRQSFDAPARKEGDDGVAWFQGRYFLGPGRYKVDWLMRNLQGRVCSAHWRTHAPRPSYGGRPAAAASSNLIAPYHSDTFEEEPPVSRDAGLAGGLHLLLLVNLSPLERSRFKLSEYELDSLVGMMRSLHREPSVGLFSLTAFSAYDRRIVYETKRQTRLDFPALGQAVEAAPAGVVDIDALADEEGEQRFLADLINEALAPAAERPDAIVVLGLKVDRDAIIPKEMIDIAGAGSPLFRFAFNRNPRSYPWPGAIEAALAPFGLTVYSITRPQDYTRAVAGLLDAIEARPAAGATAAAPRP